MKEPRNKEAFDAWIKRLGYERVKFPWRKHDVLLWIALGVAIGGILNTI